MRKSPILTAFRFLFLFKKPRFIELDFIDLIIDNHPIFLITWKINNGHKLKIKPLNKSYNNAGSLLFRLPKHSYTVQLLASNFWRTTKKAIELKHIELDKETASCLIQTFQPITSIGIRVGNISVKNSKAKGIRKFVFGVKSNKIHPQTKFELIRKQFIYP